MTHISSIIEAEAAKDARRVAAEADARAAGCTCTDADDAPLCPCCIAWAESRRVEMDALLGEPVYTAAQIAAEVAEGREPAFGLSAEVVIAALAAYERREDARVFSEQRAADTVAMLQVDQLPLHENGQLADQALGYGRWVCYHRAPDAPYAEPFRLQLGGYVYKSYGFLTEVLDAQGMLKGNGCHHVLIGLAAGVTPPAEMDADLGLGIMYGSPRGRSERLEAADLVTNSERMRV